MKCTFLETSSFFVDTDYALDYVRLYDRDTSTLNTCLHDNMDTRM